MENKWHNGRYKSYHISNCIEANGLHILHKGRDWQNGLKKETP